MTTSQPPPPPPPYAGSLAASTSDERNWAMAAHLGSLLTAWFFLGPIVPLFVLMLKGEDSAFIHRNAVESLNFQINAVIYSVVLFLMVFAVIGILLLPAYVIFYLVCVFRASLRCSYGEEYRYPMTIRFVS